MNCNNFEAIISDLAREQMLEANLRESALLHMEACEACTARLETERALTRGLRSLAVSMKQLEAPAPVEACLLAKFRERTVAAQEEVSPVVVQMPQRATRWQRWYPHAVAAAVLLMFAIGGASMLRVRDGERPASQSDRAVASNNSKAEGSARPLTSNATPASVDEVAPQTAAPVENPDSTEGGRRLSPREVAAIYNPTTPRSVGNQNFPKSDVNKSVKTSTSREIATDFMPVSYGDNLNEIDNGRIVRVEMPRSALAQFGIPVNMDRANERIKADVLIGDDGMARAIRFVR
ncbi:MAG TPA: hypothetical protein VGC66_07265 [Pyrinomonadaceae bacterium]|jgi:hypothetical protein